MTKEQAEQGVAAAERGCSAVGDAWDAAVRTLTGDVSMNWYGVYSDPTAVRAQLLTAQACINDALRELGAVQWPTNADYDQL